MPNDFKSTGAVALQRVRQALEKNDPEAAVRCLAAAVMDGHLEDGSALVTRLARELGVGATRRLIRALGEYPCFVCRGGLELCANCGARGRVGGALCEPCLGLGVCNCKFCGGSGWVTINFVPAGLRFGAILHRIGRTRKEMAAILKARRGSGRLAVDAKVSLKEDGRAVVRWNRVMAILENAILGLRMSCGRESVGTKARAHWIGQCAVLGARADKQVRLLFEEMAGEGEEATRDGAFYADLAAEPAALAELEHPFLRRAMAAIQRRKMRPQARKGAIVKKRAAGDGRR